MPLDNFNKNHFTEEQITSLHESMDALLAIISGITVNLTPAERSKYGKVGNRSILLIENVKDYHESQPNLKSPDVDWVEFEKDYKDRKQAAGMISKVKSIHEMLLNIKILGDYDNYNASLMDYKYAQYKTRFADSTGVGYESKIDELKVFFPKTGKKTKGKKEQ